MSSQWLNEYSIMRDLSRAQGCVPVDVMGAVVAADKPPVQKICEENEEEFFRGYDAGSGDVKTPDLGLIKHMIKVVREQEALREDSTEKLMKITKVSPLSFNNCNRGQEAIINPIQKAGIIERSNHKPIHEKKLKSRNVAIASLLENKQNEKLMLEEPPERPAKVELPKMNQNNNIAKVNSCLVKQEKTKKPAKYLKPTLDFSCMFKRRETKESPQKPVEVTPPQNVHKNYVPSSEVEEYYKLLQKKSKMKEMLQEDVWSRVQKEMKEIDEKRMQFKQYLESTKDMMSSHDNTFSRDFEDEKFKDVRLIDHRHMLSSRCIVCAVNMKSKNLVQHLACEKPSSSTPIENVKQIENNVLQIENDVVKIDNGVQIKNDIQIDNLIQKTAYQELEDFIGSSF